jgi:hypothetical protein
MSNLPPGVTDDMIPGNRPEDIEFQDAYDDITMLISRIVEGARYIDEFDIRDILEDILMDLKGDK